MFLLRQDRLLSIIFTCTRGFNPVRHITDQLLSRKKCAIHLTEKYAGLAQLFRALPCQGRGRELESLNPHHEKCPTRWGFFHGHG